jgi:hypothetical protein
VYDGGGLDADVVPLALLFPMLDEALIVYVLLGDRPVTVKLVDPV